MQIFSSKQE